MDITLRTPNGPVKIQQTALDRAISWISPKKGVDRLRARASLALSGYTGASRTRRSLKSWVTSDADANTALLGDLPELRERSRDLVRNSPIASGALNTVVGSVIGPGLKLNPAIDHEYIGITPEAAQELERTVERYWHLWTKDCDITRTQTFEELQSLVFRSVLESGDAFTILPSKKRKSSPFSLKVQVIEADRVSNKDNATDTVTLAGGVQTDSNGAPIAYHILKTHPGNDDAAEGDEWQVVPAFGKRSGRRNVLHHYKKTRPGQFRGAPYLATVLESIKQLERYTNAELMSAVVAGMFTVFVKSEGADGLDVFSPDDEVGGEADDEDYKMGNGAIVRLGPNDDISTANPGRPNSVFEQFVAAIYKQIGVNLEVPYEVLTKHFASSYSAARGAILEAWRFYNERRAWVASSYCQPIYEAFFDELVGRGLISAPGYFSDPLLRQAYTGAMWVGRPQGQLDPKKEMEANAIAEDRSWKTAKQNTAELTGGDWDKNNAQRIVEQKLRIDGGLAIDPAAELEEAEEPEQEEIDNANS